MRVIILGPPGTGKGTISEFIRRRFECAHISTGDLLRGEIRKETHLGKKIASTLSSGKLVGDETVLSVLREKLIAEKGCFVLDGFPRNVKQAEMLDSLLDENAVELDLVLEIDSSEKMIVKRLSARRQCVKCRRIYGLDVPPKNEGVCDDCKSKLVLRSDDKPEVVKKRLAVYSEQTVPVIDFYEKKGLLRKINGDLSLHEIFSEVEALLKKECGVD